VLSSANILSTTATSVSAITATPCCSSIGLISSGLLARTAEVGIAVGFGNFGMFGLLGSVPKKKKFQFFSIFLIFF